MRQPFQPGVPGARVDMSSSRWRQGARTYFSDPKMMSEFTRLVLWYLGITTVENLDDYFVPVFGQFDGGVSILTTIFVVYKVVRGIGRQRPPKLRRRRVSR